MIEPMTTTTSPTLTIRPAYGDDQVALHRLAALDSAAAPPPTPLLVAEVDGELRVALSLHDDNAIADPFFPTVGILALLRAHAKNLELARRPQSRDTVLAWRRGVQGLAGLLGARSA